MSRTSGDEYKLSDGTLEVLTCLAQDRPEGAVLWNGYDYEVQCWVIEGVSQGHKNGKR